jgi:hypothetical protein
LLGALLPLPGQEFVQTVLRVSGDTGEDIGQLGLGIDVVELGRHDEGDHDGGSFGAAV